MKLRSGLLTILVLAVVGYSGAKFFVEYKVKNKLDEMVRLASPFMEANYGNVSSDLRGKLRIDNISLDVPDGAVLEIGSIEIEGPGPRFLWDLTGGFKDSEPPTSLVLKLRNASIPVDQGLTGNFGPITLGGDADNQRPVQPCTLGGLLKHAGLEQLGVENLVADAVMGYRFNKSTGEARVFLDYELIGIESTSLTVSLQGIPAPGSVVMGALPSFSDLDLTYSLKPEYIKGLVGYCAQQAQQSDEAFLNTVFTQPDKLIARGLGFVPGPGIQEMLRTLLTKGGLVQLTANPPDDLDPATLFAYKPEDIVNLLDIELSLDDKPVRDLSMSFVADGAALSGLREFGLSNRNLAEDATSDDSEAMQTEVRKERPQLRYVETGISDLHRYIGSRVKLYTRNSGKPKQGFLTNYKRDTFSVEQNIHKGTMTAHVHISEIAKAEVLRRTP
ncbi:MAG: hypothetical protein GY792_18095 [Gammaproteobacteria bacterium]|nr:hypothetical protein [Gammaproteobacteria bacterium]